MAILVTGAAGGLGYAIAKAAALKGYDVIGTDVQEVAGGAYLADLPGNHRFLKLDVRSSEAWKDAVASLEGEGVSVDRLVLNAGVMTRPTGAPALDDFTEWFTEDGFNKVTSVNIGGVVLGLRVFLDHLRRSPQAEVLAMSSAAGLTPLPLDPYYSLSKHAVVGFVRSIGPVLEAHGVRVKAVCPGAVSTNLAPRDLREAVSFWADPDFIAEEALKVLDNAAGGEVWSIHHDGPGGVWRQDPPDLAAAAELAE